jgi:hypothetical protein
MKERRKERKKEKKRRKETKREQRKICFLASLLLEVVNF